MELDNSTVSGNSASEYGGGLFSSASSLGVSYSSLSGNQADTGGGAYNKSGTMTLSNSTVSGNKASAGGGLYNGENGSVTLSNSTLFGNSATSHYGNGGGLFSYVTSASDIFINYFHVAPQHFGWIFAANAAGLITMSQVNGQLLRRTHYHPEKIIYACLSVQSLAALALMAAGLLRLGFVAVVVPLFFFIAVMGAVFPNNTALALRNQKERAGAASSMMGTLQFLMSTIASALISFLHAKTPTPMCLTMGVCGLTAFALYNALGLKNPVVRKIDVVTPPAAAI